jgi:glycosyltransferase involved in cell wall biosynthesis
MVKYKPNLVYDDFVELEEKKFDSSPDVVIQNVLPSILEYVPGAYNIGLFYLETKGLKHTGWLSRINLMDEIWVASNSEKQCLVEMGVVAKISVVPMPMNTEDFQMGIEPMNIDGLENDFIFYFIGAYTPRKNVQALVLAFHREFSSADPVRLVIKSHSAIIPSDKLLDKITDDLTEQKKTMRLHKFLYGYTPETLIIQNLTDDEIAQLHARGDCFVMPSRGESLCRPVMDALYMGNDVIVTANTGMEDIVEGKGLCVESHETPAFTKIAAVADLYTAHETWREIDILDLQKKMRQSYERRDSQPERGSQNRHSLFNKYSYPAIGAEMEGLLNGVN